MSAIAMALELLSAPQETPGEEVLLRG